MSYQLVHCNAHVQRGFWMGAKKASGYTIHHGTLPQVPIYVNGRVCIIYSNSNSKQPLLLILGFIHHTEDTDFPVTRFFCLLFIEYAQRSLPVCDHHFVISFWMVYCWITSVTMIKMDQGWVLHIVQMYVECTTPPHLTNFQVRQKVITKTTWLLLTAELLFDFFLLSPVKYFQKWLGTLNLVLIFPSFTCEIFPKMTWYP